MSYDPKAGDTARYVRLTGLITPGEGLVFEVEELEVVIVAVHEALEKLGVHLMLTWRIVTDEGSWTIAATGPQFEARGE